MTIINIRGTSGSGKSTVVRAIMDKYAAKSKVYTKDRKRPLGYVLNRPEGRPLFVVGHYETDCGGCDTIPSVDRVYEIVEHARKEGMDVLYEGLLISAEFRRTLAIHEQNPGESYVIGMNLPLEDCLAGVNHRRHEKWLRRVAKTEEYNAALKARAAKKGRPEPVGRAIPEPRGEVSERNTKSKWKATETTMRKLGEQGVAAEWHNRETAVARIAELLNL